ncbi:SDR family NAD(P)-dependent oxidoreductase [Amycolatopsis silviterrae]|uniref:SDR family NAD(P)-dependent oxidoreductase n=1 Tax=Amycolatopsis silviterrae TaxID=1656914 RepID=A0ABW5H3B9_9PSEU
MNVPVAVVTGGASGIGQATAELLAGTGYRVAVLDLVPADIDGVRSIECDVTARASVRQAVDEVVGTLGVPELVVTSAGIYRPAEALDITDEDYDLSFAVNVRGTFLVSQLFAAAMTETGGAIVTVSSVAARQSTPENVLYSATKGAVEALTRGLAVSLAPYGIRANGVAPGPVATAMGHAAAADPEYEKRMLARVLSRSFATPAEIASAIAYLGSRAASQVTGQILPVDGGVLVCR